MTRLFRFILPLLIFLVVLPLARAQSTAGTLSITHLEAITEESGEVRVSALVSVLDEAGQPVEGLTADDFTVSENNLPLDNQLLTVSRAGEPLSIALIIDTSQSMADPGPDRVRAIDAAKDAAVAFIERLGDDDQVAVYEFNSRPVSQQDFTLDHNLAIDQGVVKLDARDVAEACLNDALLQVINRLSTESKGPRAVIALTGPPGGEACPVTPVEEVVDAATTVGNTIPIFTVAFGDNLDEEQLRRLGQGTGGRTLLAPDSTTLTDQIMSTSQQLKSQYTISYPTHAAAGLATVIVFENGSELSDRRQVVIPEPIEPTPTPVPHYSISLSVDQPAGDKLEIMVSVPEGITLTQTSLYVDDQLVEKAVEPPLDQFTLDVNKLGSGKHVIRVETTDSNQVDASAEVELMLTIPPTATPPPTAPPAAAEVAPPAASEAESSMPVLPLVLICAGLLLLVALLGLAGYLLFSRSKQLPTPAVPARPSSPPPPPTVPRPASPMMPDDDADKTLLQAPMPGAAAAVGSVARLVVVAGHELVSPPEYSLHQPETKIGRNTQKEPNNDIAVQDKEVSRSHATIVARHQQYFIQDLNSTMGTHVDGLRLQPGQEMMLQPGAEIMIGPRVKFRFEVEDEGETLLDVNMDDLRAKYQGEDPFRTQYD